jgi:hypothetical protein
MILMKGIPRHSKPVLLPFGALITQIADSFGISTAGTTMVPEKPLINRKFLLSSDSHVKRIPRIPVQPLAETDPDRRIDILSGSS